MTISEAISEKPGLAEEVLAVEDSPTQRELLKYILEAHGYRVRTAAHGAEALACLRASRPATVISDVLMPELDGYELCRRIKTDPELRDIPVILLTALQDPRDVIKGLECGADNFIVKPLDEHYLLSQLEYILANRNLRDREHPARGIEIVFAGQKYFINSNRRQILDLLLSIYEAAARKNSELLKAQEELKAANADLEQRVSDRTAKLEEANKSLESFCYSIAHDLRAPLRGIQGFTRILLEDYQHLYDEAGRDSAQRVVNAAQQMDQLIQDLLAYGRVSQAELPRSPVSLESALDHALAQLGQEITARKAEIQVDRPLPNVVANTTILQQVFHNLITNALKFVPENIPPRVHIWAQRNGDTVRLNVQDHGIGFDPIYADRLFRLFERLHSKQKYPGTGVGLVIVRKGIERMGGKVGVQSQPGVGSTFWVELPAEAQS